MCKTSLTHELAISYLTTKRSHELATLSHLAEWKVKNTEAIAIKEDCIRQLTRSIDLLKSEQLWNKKMDELTNKFS